ncbi:hypothetical protein [Aeromicrobium choanae]|uniref:Uncharacterized protein n=1 Tax=Aeromicrobium choanae TaxID=1736691 RepID=A0A1T4YP78_9ACTN|nr:hypothetical protein [Aeromicrobium choanae]SKB03644.1 hypothetical protein SAMN06295964_0303 [Aeromicrobium choanae]
MRIALKTLCVLTIPVMLISFVASERTGSPLASIAFTVTLVVTGFGLLNIATEYAWADDED